MLTANGKTIDIEAIIQSIRNDRTIPTRRKYDYVLSEHLKLIECIGASICRGFVIDDENRGVYESLVKWALGDESMECINPLNGETIKGDMNKGIYLAGNTGSGKSVALVALRIYCSTLRLRRYTSEESEMLDWFNYLCSDLVTQFSKGNDISFATKNSIICFQDLGSEMQEAIYMGNRVNVMKNILETRGDLRERLTLITSNLKLGGTKLNDRYGERVESRLIGMCNYLILAGTDRRK